MDESFEISLDLMDEFPARGVAGLAAAETTGRSLSRMWAGSSPWPIDGSLRTATGSWNIYMMSSFESEAAKSGDLRVVMENFEFSPDPVKASGGSVGVHVTNKDDTLHTFTIKELGVDLAVPGGKSARVIFSGAGGIPGVL